MLTKRKNHDGDAKGVACPMPIIKTKKAMEEIETDQVLEESLRWIKGKNRFSSLGKIRSA